MEAPAGPRTETSPSAETMVPAAASHRVCAAAPSGSKQSAIKRQRTVLATEHPGARHSAGHNRTTLGPPLSAGRGRLGPPPPCTATLVNFPHNLRSDFHH